MSRPLWTKKPSSNGLKSGDKSNLPKTPSAQRRWPYLRLQTSSG